MANRWGNSRNSGWLFFWAPKSLQMVIAAMKLKTPTPSKESYDQPRQHIKKQRQYFAHKGPSSQGYGFSSGHVWVWELDYKESWAQKNWCFWTVVLEKTFESPLDCKEIQPVHPKGDQSWVSIGRTDVEAETPILWLPDVEHWLIWKDPDVGKDWGQAEKGTTEDEMIGWHHWLNGHESEVAQSCPTVSDPMDCNTPGLPVHHQLPELTQTPVHWVGDAIQPSCPRSSPFPPAFNLSQRWGLFYWVGSLQQVDKVLEHQQ